MLKAILFDLGDTLFDFRPMKMSAVCDEAARITYAYLQGRGFALPPYRTYLNMQYRGIRMQFLLSRIVGRDFSMYTLLCRNCRRMNLQLSEQELRDLAWRWYEPVTAYCSVCDDVVPTLAKLRDAGLKLGLISNTFIPGFVLDMHMDRHGLLEFFPTRVYSSEIGHRKPGARIFRTALDALGVSPGETAMVGDRIPADIRGARRLGMTTILRHPQAQSRTHRTADHVVRNMTELHQILPLL
jgi:HAD superfamily hydrolase (TIGR01549 family)